MRPPTLGASARASVLWGGGSTLVRDFVQFATMLVLVRLLSPTDYGSMALAQTVVGLLSVVSFGTLVMHALQLRDPDDVDWQGHFTAALAVNFVLFVLTLGVALLLSRAEHFSAAAFPLALLSLVFLVEIPATLRHRMLQVAHDWKRFRLLILAGTVLGAVAGVTVAALGGGVMALAIQPVLFGLPGAIDLLFVVRWRPDWSWSWPSYRETAIFGANRIGSGVMGNVRQASEQALLAGTYDFAALGVFTRSVGLANLIAGRVGSVTSQALYPVVTRAAPRSVQFRRFSALILRGVAWITIPAAILLAIEATDVVAVLYGPKWVTVAPLLPLACASVALAGISATAYYLLMANEELRLCLALDICTAIAAVGLALWLIPYGPAAYLIALSTLAAVVLVATLALLVQTGGIEVSTILKSLLPPVMACAMAIAAVWLLRRGLSALFPTSIDATSTSLPTLTLQFGRLLPESFVFTGTYALALNLCAPAALVEILDVMPGRQYLRKLLPLTRSKAVSGEG